MTTAVKLKVITGKLKGQEYVFKAPTTCTIGRANECNLQLPNDQDHSSISRYHCCLNINPPQVHVRDLGSRHGTYVNGENIGQRSDARLGTSDPQQRFPEYELKPGDRLQLSDLVFQIDLETDEPAVNLNSLQNQTYQTVQIASERNYAPKITPSKPNLLLAMRDWIQQFSEENNSPSLLPIPGYQVEKKLGEGAFGEVYLARHQRSGEFVALKFLLPEAAANQHQRNKFLRELENNKALNHPNIVQLRDYGIAEDSFFFSLEYCDGGTLEDLIKRRGRPLAINEALPLIFQVLDGLEYAHQAEIPYVKLAHGQFVKGNGLVHRDIKPSNILLKNLKGQPTVKIADFGVAKAFDRAGMSGFTASGADLEGTFYFMPREQVINFKYAQPNVDVWATAACLYYLLTGALPRNFHSKDPLLVVLQTNPVPIRQRNRGIPKALAEVIDLALVDYPQIYFKQAADFRKALQEVL